jgi:hypothetical protein
MAGDMESYLQQRQQAEAYQELLQQAVDLLARGDAAGFAPLLSANLRQAAGEATVTRVIREQLIPFFADFQEFGGSTTVTNATDAYGNEGLSFYKSIRTRAGAERPFVIYIVEEAGRPVVANLLVNTTYEDMHEGRGPE